MKFQQYPRIFYLPLSIDGEAFQELTEEYLHEQGKIFAVPGF